MQLAYIGPELFHCYLSPWIRFNWYFHYSFCFSHISYLTPALSKAQFLLSIGPSIHSPLFVSLTTSSRLNRIDANLLKIIPFVHIRRNIHVFSCRSETTGSQCVAFTILLTTEFVWFYSWQNPNVLSLKFFEVNS